MLNQHLNRKTHLIQESKNENHNLKDRLKIVEGMRERAELTTEETIRKMNRVVNKCKIVLNISPKKSLQI